MSSLEERVALITGAGSGIGRATALLMAEQGADVIINDIDAEAAEKTATEVRERGRRALVFVADVSRGPVVRAAISDAEAAAGRIDVLVNNAGIGGQEKALEELEDDEFQRMFDVHVKGAFNCTKAVVPGMKQRRTGKIITISSNRGLVGFERGCDYCGAKAALLGLTKAWAKELAPWNIRVNAVAPGVVLTPMNTANGMDAMHEEASWNLLKRWAEPVEIAYSVAFLASEEADFITGQVINPNGGDPVVGI